MIMKKTLVLPLLVAVAACGDLTVPNLNNPTAGEAATRSSVVVNAQGLLVSARGLTVQGVRTIGTWGRESYNLRPQEPRPYTDNLIGPRDPSSQGMVYFATNYTALADVRSLLQSVDGVQAMTEPEKEAIRGWAKTVAAFSYFQLAVHHTAWGAPLEPPASATGELAEIVPSATLYKRSLDLFDEAQGHLRNGGSSFPFRMSAGYQGFNTPAQFIRVNRALKARTLKYMGRWSDALVALNESFVDGGAALTLGAYHSYDPADGAANPFFDVRDDYIHPRIRGEAQRKPDGTLDDRALQKTEVLPTRTVFNVTVSAIPALHRTANSPMPWIRNEELLLIRAEANYALGNKDKALEDVNRVRTAAGGLAPLAAPISDAALLDEILYNRRYSLLWEGGFAFLDAVQYDRIAELPRALPEHVVFTRFNYPLNECLARAMNTGPCGTITGIP